MRSNQERAIPKNMQEALTSIYMQTKKDVNYKLTNQTSSDSRIKTVYEISSGNQIIGNYNHTLIQGKSKTAEYVVMHLNENPLGERPTWNEYFMAKAILSSTMTSCCNVHAGSVAVDLATNIELGSGYNGPSSAGLESCLDVGCRKKAIGEEYGKEHGKGTCWGTHSEQNAVSNITRNTKDPFAVYATIFSCSDCATNLMGYHGFKQFFFKSGYDEREVENVLTRYHNRGVLVSRLNLSPERLNDIILNRPDVKIGVWSPEERKRIQAKYLNK